MDPVPSEITILESLKIINESSIKELMHKHSIPISFAKHAKSKCSKANVNFIVEVFLKNYKTMVENTYTYLTTNDKISMVMDKIRFLESNIYSNNLDKQINVDPETISTLDNSIQLNYENLYYSY